MRKKIIIAILIFVVVLGIVFIIRNTNTQEIQTESQDVKNSSEVSSESLISLEDLSKHNNLEDCWISYGGKVYDITSFLPRHPGTPEKILPYCGSAEEFEKAFTKKHGTSKVNMLIQVGTFIGDFDLVGNKGN